MRLRVYSLLMVSLVWSGLSVGKSWAQEPLESSMSEHSTGSSILKARSAEIRLGIEQIKLPGDEKAGMVGASYLLEAWPHVYVGPAAYGTASGSRGGFFTGGWEAAWRYPLSPRLDFEAGLYAGGGGGHAAPVGGGLMLRPHADLLWHVGNGIHAGLSLSEVKFPSGSIRSHQLGLVVSIDDQFAYTESDAVGQAFPVSRRGGVGFDRVGLTAFSYKPHFTDSSTGHLETESVGLVGFRLEQQSNEHWLWGIEAAGAGKGSSSGYAEVLGSVGAEIPVLTDQLHVGARAALGMGGGGSVAVGSGLLAKTGLYARYDIGRDWFLGVEGGYVAAPQHDFRAKYGMVSLGLQLDHPLNRSTSSSFSDGMGSAQEWEWSPALEHYHSALRKDGSSERLETVGIKLQKQWTPHLYVSGQAHSAYAGGAGAFSVGLAGIGMRSNLSDIGLGSGWSNLDVGAEFLVGAAGGGGVETRGGAVVQPMVYTRLHLNKTWSLQVGAGKIRSLKEGLNTSVLDVSLGYSFGVPAR